VLHQLHSFYTSILIVCCKSAPGTLQATIMDTTVRALCVRATCSLCIRVCLEPPYCLNLLALWAQYTCALQWTYQGFVLAV
jgi:hypothetical protein